MAMFPLFFPCRRHLMQSEAPPENMRRRVGPTCVWVIPIHPRFRLKSDAMRRTCPLFRAVSTYDPEPKLHGSNDQILALVKGKGHFRDADTRSAGGPHGAVEPIASTAVWKDIPGGDAKGAGSCGRKG